MFSVFEFVFPDEIIFLRESHLKFSKESHLKFSQKEIQLLILNVTQAYNGISLFDDLYTFKVGSYFLNLF